jgi:hypothetical protein
MTRTIEGTCDANVNYSSEELREAAERITEGYKRRFAQLYNRVATIDPGNALDSLFTPLSDEQQGALDLLVLEARNEGFVKHEGADGYSYYQTPEGSAMFTLDGVVIVKLN